MLLPFRSECGSNQWSLMTQKLRASVVNRSLEVTEASSLRVRQRFRLPEICCHLRTDTWLRLRRVQLAADYLPRRSGAAERGLQSRHLAAQAASTACPETIPSWPLQHISQFLK